MSRFQRRIEDYLEHAGSLSSSKESLIKMGDDASEEEYGLNLKRDLGFTKIIMVICLVGIFALLIVTILLINVWAQGSLVITAGSLTLMCVFLRTLYRILRDMIAMYLLLLFTDKALPRERKSLIETFYKGYFKQSSRPLIEIGSSDSD